MKIAAAYLRVSLDRQDEYSLDSQLKLIREYADKNDYIVPDEYVFIDDGISGRSAKNRQQFQNMVAMAKDKSHPFEAVLLWKFSRFARNQEESILYKSMLSRCGVSVISISEPIVDGPFGSLLERILEWMDEFYSIRLSGEVRRGMTERVSRGQIVSTPSFGYAVKDKSYVPDENADTVRRIYADFLAGKGLRAIAQQLSDEGVRTRRGNPPENRWVRYILENPVYIGKLRWTSEGHANYSRAEKNTEGSILVDAGHEHIIDDATWEAVQARLAESDRGAVKYARKDPERVDWMLKGLVRCSACGSTLVYTSTACPSMQCHKYAHGACSVSHALSIAKADRIVVEALESCIASHTFPLRPLPVAPVSGKDYTKLISAERTKLRRVQEAYEAGIDTLQEYAEKKAKISASIKALEAEAADICAAAPAPDLDAYAQKVSSVLDIVKDPSASQLAKNTALRSILSYIIYDKAAAKLALYFYI